MTYSEKLFELNYYSLRTANRLFAAKLLLEQAVTRKQPISRELEENVELLHLEYEEALNSNNNLRTFIISNKINLASGFLQAT